MSFERSINAIEHAARIARQSAQAAVSVSPPTAVSPTYAPVYIPASPPPSAPVYAQRQSLPAYFSVGGLQLQWDPPQQTATIQPAEDVLQLSVQERDAAIVTAIEAETAYQELSESVSRGEIQSPSAVERRMGDARAAVDDAWADVGERFDEEFVVVSDATLEAVREPAVEAYRNNLDLTHVYPVYRPWVLEQAGVAGPPTDLDQARVDTSVAATRFLEADNKYEDLSDLQSALPGAMQPELAGEVGGAQLARENARIDLDVAAAHELRVAAQLGDSSDADVDVYLNEVAYLQAHLEIAGLDQVAIDSTSQNALVLARAAPPMNLNEAQAQTNGAIWNAITAENSLALHLEDGEPVNSDQAELWTTRRFELEVEANAAWREVGLRSAVELRVYADGVAGTPGDNWAMEQAYRNGIANRNFPGLYVAKIDHYVAPQAPSELFDADSAAVAAIADDYIARAQSAYDDGGSVALREELGNIYGDMTNDPYVRGDATFTPDPAESDRRLAALRELVAPGLEPLQLQLVEDFPDEIAELSATRLYPEEFDFEVDLEIANRIEETFAVIPENMVADLFLETESTWSIGLRGSAFADSPGIYIDNDDPLELTFRTYARIGNQLNEVTGGTPAFNRLVEHTIAPIQHDDRSNITTHMRNFDAAALHGEGSELMVEVINRLAASEEFLPNAEALSGALNYSSQLFMENADARLAEWSENRMELDRLIAEFNLANDRSNPLSDSAPGQLDVSQMELSDAIDEYWLRNPDIAAEDERLLREIMLDGKKLHDLQVAASRLSDDAAALEVNEVLVTELSNFLDPSEDRSALYANNSLVHASLESQFRSAFQNGSLDPADFVAAGPEGRLVWLSESQDEFGVPRNLRFMLVEFASPNHHGRSSLIPSSIHSNALTRVSGPALFTIAGTSALIDATGQSGSDLTGLDRTVAVARAGNYYYLTAREITEKGANALLTRASMPRLTEMLTNSGVRIGLQTTTGGLLEAAKRTPAVVGPRVGFVAFDGYNAWQSLENNENGMLLGGHLTSGVGSGLMLANGMGWGASTSWAGPVAWAGTALWFTGASMVYQGNRIEGYNRFETADARAFLSHIGSRDDVTGELNPIDDLTWISPFESHPDSDSFRRYVDGPPTESEIVYRGISANAVDELMNNDDNSSNPQSSLAALNALAIRNDISPNVLTVDWYNSLTNEQQKDLPVAAFSVDESVNETVLDPNFFIVYTPDSMISALIAFRDLGPLTDESFQQSLPYMTEWLFVDHPNTDFSTQVLNPEAVSGALGFGPLVPGQPAPNPEVAQTLEFLFGEDAGGFRSAYRPTNTLELETWLQVNHYPPFPAPVMPQLGNLTDRPEGVPVDIAYEPASPINHEYIVQPGDTLWDIAARSSDADDVFALIDYHNESTLKAEAEFDPARADSDFFTANELGLLSRDPDLIHPGDVVLVANVENIADDSDP